MDYKKVATIGDMVLSRDENERSWTIHDLVDCSTVVLNDGEAFGIAQIFLEYSPVPDLELGKNIDQWWIECAWRQEAAAQGITLEEYIERQHQIVTASFEGEPDKKLSEYFEDSGSEV